MKKVTNKKPSQSDAIQVQWDTLKEISENIDGDITILQGGEIIVGVYNSIDSAEANYGDWLVRHSERQEDWIVYSDDAFQETFEEVTE